MLTTIREWQNNRTLAHVLPLFVFMGFIQLANSLRIRNVELPWYQHSPEQWVYPVQTLVCGALLIFFRKNYVFRPFQGFGFATVMAILGIAVWIAPAALFDLWNWQDDTTPAWLKALGFQDRVEDGFDPSFFSQHSFLYISAIVLRIVRMVVIVAFIEEIFWRGFLMRYLIDLNTDFWKIPFGKFSYLSVGLTVFLFVLIHQPSDYVGALIYGSLACWVAIKTKSLAACVWMHALANLMLGIYILTSRNWGLW